MSDLDLARRRLLMGFFATAGIVLVLLATWSHVLAVPTPLQAMGGPAAAVPWSSISVAGLTFILAAIAWWLADRSEAQATGVAGNCRECGVRVEKDFCLRCGSTRVA